MRKERALEFRRAAMLAAQGAGDAVALTMPTMFPAWTADTAYGGAGEPQIVSRTLEGRVQLYRCQSPHTSQAGWEPENVPALWTAIQGEESGGSGDPIPAVRGMEYTYGLYYLDPEDGKVYLCKRIGETEGGTVVLQYLPHELIGQYFEVYSG